MTDNVADDAYKRWSPSAQEKALDRLRELGQKEWHPFYCPRPGCDGNHHIEAASGPTCEATPNHLHDWYKPNARWSCKACGTGGRPLDDWLFPHARANQHPPKGDWLTWLNRGGRGSGKTRTGAEWAHRRTKVSPRIALIGATGTDVRDTMIEGESGLLETAAPGQRPHYEPSKRRVTWPNGARAFVYSGEEPDRLRGPQHFDAWIDEPAHIALIEEVWSNLLFGLRLVNGRGNRICATTTPLPTKWMKELIADPTTVSVVASTYANIGNLAPQFAKTILGRYEGTRKGRQEIHGEVLADVEGALWQYEMFEPTRLHEVHPRDIAPTMDRIVVAVDPAGTKGKKSDETGIVIVGAKDDEYYVLADLSGKYSPKGWADRATGAVESWGADFIVAEVNYGGDMVKSTLDNSDSSVRVETVVSRRGKATRADPIVALYEKGIVHHVGTALGDLEDQLVSWVPGTDSPDRLDALVHGMTSLARTVDPASIASPKDLRALAGRLGPRNRLSLVRTA